jgi:hypothetical protein
MSIPRLFGLVFALPLSFVALVVFLFGLMISAHEPSSFSVAQWILGLAIGSVPFLFTFWIVYRCFCTNEMPALEILVWTVRSRALLYAIAAEVLGLFLGSLLLTAFIYLKRDPRVLLEQRTPFTQTPNLGEVPELPLSSEAVGVELPGGEFYPIMFLKGRLPEHGYKTPLLTVDAKAGPPRLKVYRGTNELAAANHFLGEFQILGYSRAKQSLQLMVIFDLETDRRLFLKVRDVDATHNIALKPKRIESTKSQ